MGLFQEFKEFAARGNVIDLAVGVIIGAAFGKIVTSLVEQVVMPPIGLLLGRVDFSNLEWVLAPEDPATEAVEKVADYVGYGLNHLVFHAPGHDQRRFLELFERDLLPRLRKLS